MRGRLFIRRNLGSNRDELARLDFLLVGINQAVTACPDIISTLRQIGDNEAALIIGHNDFDVAHRLIARFRNHPDAGFGAVGACDCAADIVFVDFDRLFGRSLRLLRIRGQASEETIGEKGRGKGLGARAHVSFLPLRPS